MGARAEALIRRWGVGAVAVTLGARGALLSYGEGAPMVVPAVPVTGGDPCGAGDSFAAAAALALADGAVTGEAVAVGGRGRLGVRRAGRSLGVGRGPSRTSWPSPGPTA